MAVGRVAPSAMARDLDEPWVGDLRSWLTAQCLQPEKIRILIKMKTESIQATGKMIDEHVVAKFWRGKTKLKIQDQNFCSGFFSSPCPTMMIIATSRANL